MLFSNPLTALEKTLALVVLVLIAVIGFAWYFGHLGFQRCEAKAEKEVVTQVEHNAVVEKAGVKANDQADKESEHATQKPLDPLPPQPVARLHSHDNCPVPQAGSGGAAGPGAAPVRTETSPSVVPEEWSAFERSDVSDARDADIEVTRLQRKLQIMYSTCNGEIAK